MTKTKNYNLELPDESRNISEEFPIIRTNTEAIDEALYANKQEVDKKAEKEHTHEISGINGLQSALDKKMSVDKTFGVTDLQDIDNFKDAAKGYILSKDLNGKCVFVSPAAALGAHKHKVADISDIDENYLNKKPKVLQAGTNINDLTQSGFYALSGKYLNGPLGTSEQYEGHLWLSISEDTPVAITQMIFNGGKFWVRILSLSSSTGWQRIITNENAEITKSLTIDGKSQASFMNFNIQNSSNLSSEIRWNTADNTNYSTAIKYRQNGGISVVIGQKEVLNATSGSVSLENLDVASGINVTNLNAKTWIGVKYLDVNEACTVQQNLTVNGNLWVNGEHIINKINNCVTGTRVEGYSEVGTTNIMGQLPSGYFVTCARTGSIVPAIGGRQLQIHIPSRGWLAFGGW